MSGRLIILRHKSWNVWNRENIEKVKRDERINLEEKKQQTEKERKLQSEKIRELLYDRNNIKEKEEEEGEEEGDREEKRNNNLINRRIENEEYKKEKEEKELLQKRREGSAPWALGEGSSEFKKVSPWYLEKKNEKDLIRINGKILTTNDEIQAALDRDSERKKMEDPMATFLHTAEYKEDIEYENSNNSKNQLIIRNSQNSIPITTNPTTTQVTSSNNITSNLPGLTHLNPFLMGRSNVNNISNISNHDNSNNSNEEKKHKKRKHKSKKEKKSNKKSKKKSKKKDHRREKEQSSDSSSSSSSSSDFESDLDSVKEKNKNSISKREYEILRQKRNEREKNEKIRENLLISGLCD